MQDSCLQLEQRGWRMAAGGQHGWPWPPAAPARGVLLQMAIRTAAEVAQTSGPGFCASPRSAEGVACAQQSSCPSGCQLLVHLPISVHVPSVLSAPPSILPAPPSLLNTHPFIFKAPPSILTVHAVLSTPPSHSLLHTQPSSLHVPGPTHTMV